jgi:hypothetical protein
VAFIGHHPGRYVDEKALFFGDHLPRPLVSVHENELMDPVGCVSFPHSPLLEQVFFLNVTRRFRRQEKTAWGKAMKLFEG